MGWRSREGNALPSLLRTVKGTFSGQAHSTRNPECNLGRFYRGNHEYCSQLRVENAQQVETSEMHAGDDIEGRLLFCLAFGRQGEQPTLFWLGKGTDEKLKYTWYVTPRRRPAVKLACC